MRSWLFWRKNVTINSKVTCIATTGRAVALLKKGAKTKTKRKPAIKFNVDLGKFSVEHDDELPNKGKLTKAIASATPQKKSPFSSISTPKRDEEEKMQF